MPLKTVKSLDERKRKNSVGVNTKNDKISGAIVLQNWKGKENNKRPNERRYYLEGAIAKQ